LVKDFCKCDIKDLTPDSGVVQSVIERSRDTSVGPDGIPYSCYKTCLSISVPLLLAFLQLLLCSNICLEQALVVAFMVFLPKKSYNTLPGGMKLYRGDCLRPLSLSNCFIKLAVTAMRVCLCRIVDSKIHRFQKCIAGRQILENVIEVDTAMHTFSINSKVKDTAAAMFFDFLAAFPSVAHEYLFAILAAAGLPSAFVHAIKKLYDRNWHVIKLSGKLYNGPQILAGVRQGCPLSMILFAICIEPLLRMLEKAISPGDVVGSFADDIAAVLQNMQTTLPRLLVIFKIFGLASGL